MEEKERYELQEIFEDGSFHWCLKDNDTKLLKSLVSLHNCVDLLNQQNNQNQKLCQQIVDLNKENNKLRKFRDDILQVQAEPYRLYKENQQLKEQQKQLAIEELEKLKEHIVLNDKYDEDYGCNIIRTFDLLEDIRDRIKKLKGE